ncbi:MAG: Xaa-Pro peptidase family protein [Candidatus Omnitrophota bacterium]
MKEKRERQPDQERIKGLQEALEKNGLDLLVLRLPENVTAFGGYYPLTGLNFLLFPREDEPVLLVPESEKSEAEEGWWNNLITFEFGTITATAPYRRIEEILKEITFRKGKQWKRIGYEGSFEFLAPALLSGEGFYPARPTHKILQKTFENGELVDCTDLLHNLRAIKTKEEIVKLRTAGKIAEIGLAKFKEVAAPGRSPAEIAGLVTSAIMKEGIGIGGAQKVGVFPQVTSGPEDTAKAWRPCVITTNRVIQEGDLVLIELGVVADGFWADVTRTRVAGKASARQKEVFRVILEAQQAAKDKIHPGVACSEVDGAARTIIEKAGLGEYFVHITGHGIGFRYHEPIPFLHPANTDILKAGMVFSVEPGVYLPGFGGIRIEDVVALTEKGILTLTNFERDLDVGVGFIRPAGLINQAPTIVDVN